jgi:hypothetical protein
LSKPPSDFSCGPFPAERGKNVKDWRATGPSDHFVQFYRTDDYLIECLAGYVAEGIWNRDRAIVIATAGHRIALEERLRAKGVDVVGATVTGQYLALDARELLSKFMVNDRPDAEAFARNVGELVKQATQGGRRLRGFGEMVALLWAEGKRTAAIELEQLWNDLGRQHAFTLFCAYPADCANAKDGGVTLEHICQSHSCVIALAS